MRIIVSSLVRSKVVGEQVVSITWSSVPLDLILPDQPNRAVRTRMLRGVGGALSDGCPYPDMRPVVSEHAGFPCLASDARAQY